MEEVVAHNQEATRMGEVVARIQEVDRMVEVVRNQEAIHMEVVAHSQEASHMEEVITHIQDGHMVVAIHILGVDILPLDTMGMVEQDAYKQLH